MLETIGETAGKVWDFLNENGASSASKIEKGTGISKNDMQRAIGWLAKEDKLVVEKKGNVETLALK